MSTHVTPDGACHPQNGLRCDQKMTVQLVVRESIAGVAAEQYNFTVRCVER